jgi:hypothetical protein
MKQPNKLLISGFSDYPHRANFSVTVLLGEFSKEREQFDTEESDSTEGLFAQCLLRISGVECRVEAQSEIQQ